MLEMGIWTDYVKLSDKTGRDRLALDCRRMLCGLVALMTQIWATPNSNARGCVGAGIGRERRRRQLRHLR